MTAPDKNIPRKYLVMSQAIAQRVPDILRSRGLEPAFSDWVLTKSNEQIWLFGVLDVAQLPRLERFTDDATLHHLSTALHGLPVYISNTDGLRYSFLLSPVPRLPRRVPLPNLIPGQALIGLQPDGKSLGVPWKTLGHLMVAGMTGSGKSTFLRVLAYQALLQDMRLLIADLDGATLPMLEHHPALLAPIARTPEEAEALVHRALEETVVRAERLSRAPGYPENIAEYNRFAEQTGIDTMPRILVILDEFNATMSARGGARGKFAEAVTSLSWRGRKFGVHLVFAAQDFTKAIVGRVRDQVASVICFRVRSKDAARNVGCEGAENIPKALPGRGITDAWGPLQTYYLDKERLIEQAHKAVSIPQEEIALVRRALNETGGKMSIPQLKRWGMAERAARSLLSEWEACGWVQRDPQRYNARYITPKLEQILANK